MQKEDKEKFKNLLSDGSELVGTTAGAVIGTLLAGPVGAGVGAATGIVIEKFLEKVGSEIYERDYSHRENMRIGASTIYAYQKIAENFDKGLLIRQEGFFKNIGSLRPPADELLEGVYIKCKSSFEEKKVKYYGKFFGNVCFDIDIGLADAIYLLNLFEKLTFNQLCLLKIFYDPSGYQLNQQEIKYIKGSISQSVLFLEVYELTQFDLVKRNSNDAYLGVGPFNPSQMVLTELGDRFVKCFDLHRIKLPDLEMALDLMR